MFKARGFVARLARFGYTSNNAHKLLGIARSTVFRIANGKSRVPRIVEKLLEMYERHGVPPDHREG